MATTQITKNGVTKDIHDRRLINLTAAAAELNVLDGITATTAELNYTGGVTSNIQTQLNNRELSSNKVTSITSSSTDTQYPSAKLLYDQLATKQSTLVVNPATTSANLTSIGINGTNYALAGGTQVIWRTY